MHNAFKSFNVLFGITLWRFELKSKFVQNVQKYLQQCCKVSTEIKHQFLPLEIQGKTNKIMNTLTMWWI